MAQLLRVSIMGANPSGEKWSVNPVWYVGSDFGVPVSAAQANTIAQAFLGISTPAGLTGMWATNTTLTGFRVEARDINGVLESQAESVRGTPMVGTGTAVNPLQTCYVTSLRTGHPGPSGRGRLYWPGTGIPLQAANFRPASGTLSAINSGIQAFLLAMEAKIAITLTGVGLAVWSRKTPELYNVTSLQFGDVLDVQRRRRDQLIESYTSLSYP